MSRLADALFMLAVTLGLAVYVLVANPLHLSQSAGGDFPYYVQIAAAPLDNAVPSPWRYRLLNPVMASWLMNAGLTAEAAFFALTSVFAWISCVLMQIYLRDLGLSGPASRAGTLLFAVSVGAYIPLRRYFGYTDALTNALILLVLILALRRRYAHVTVALALGAVAKESLLLLVPFLAWRAVRDGQWRAAASMVAAPIAVFLVLRIIIAADSSGSSPMALTWSTQLEYWQTAMVHGIARWVLWSFAYSMGPIWLLAAVALRENTKFAATLLPYALAILAPLTRTTDTERALMLLFPIVIPIAAHAIEQCRGRRVALVASLTVAATWLAQLTFDWSAAMRLGPVNAKDMTFAALCVLPAIMVLAARQRQRARPLTWAATPSY
jgi:hypothetical protein